MPPTGREGLPSSAKMVDPRYDDTGIPSASALGKRQRDGGETRDHSPFDSPGSDQVETDVTGAAPTHLGASSDLEKKHRHLAKYCNDYKGLEKKWAEDAFVDNGFPRSEKTGGLP